MIGVLLGGSRARGEHTPESDFDRVRKSWEDAKTGRFGGTLADRCDMSGCHHYPLMEVARRSRRNASVPASPTEQKRVMEPGSVSYTHLTLPTNREV